MAELYDTLGRGYRELRRPDPRIGQAVLDALGNARHVLNVGAGTGSYEPRDRFVIAVEPSMTMIRQRPARAAPCVQASAVALPFRDAAFDASLAILTIHHWADWRRGVQELARSARRRVVLLTWDPSITDSFWLVDEYFPQMRTIDREICPPIEALRHELGQLSITALPIPHDCTDGFLGAYWRRPHEYLKASARQSISTFSKIAGVEEGVERLRQDLDSGAWHRRHQALLGMESLDLGYRLIATA